MENANKVAADVKNLGRKALALRMNVSDFQEVNTCVQKVYDEFKHIDMLVNAAGYGEYVLFAEMR